MWIVHLYYRNVLPCVKPFLLTGSVNCALDKRIVLQSRKALSCWYHCVKQVYNACTCTRKQRCTLNEAMMCKCLTFIIYRVISHWSLQLFSFGFCHLFWFLVWFSAWGALLYFFLHHEDYLDWNLLLKAYLKQLCISMPTARFKPAATGASALNLTCVYIQSTISLYKRRHKHKLFKRMFTTYYCRSQYN